MKLFWRRVIYMSFILAFFIIAPLLIFYTSGYRINLKKMEVEKTGILVLETDPEGAEIYIENKKVEEYTPVQINNVFPNTYFIKLQKDGFHPWQKNLKINNNSTTFAKGIILFKKSLPILKMSGDISDIYLLPQKEKIIYLQQLEGVKKIKLWDIKTENDLDIYQLIDEEVSFDDLIKSTEENKIVIPVTGTNGTKYLLYNLSTFELIDLTEETKINYELLRWHDINENTLFGYKAGIIYQIDLLTLVPKRILAGSIKDFIVKDLNIYFITTDNYINLQDLEQFNELKSIKLPTNSNLFFDRSIRNYLTLIDKTNQDLIIVNTGVFDDNSNLIDHIILQSKAKKSVWTQVSQNLLFYNDFEVWVYNFDSQDTTLISRLSQPINKAFWYTDNKYVVYQTKNKIRVAELDSRDRRNDILLTQIKDISNSFIDKDGEKIYFAGRIGNQQGIFELQIR